MQIWTRDSLVHFKWKHSLGSTTTELAMEVPQKLKVALSETPGHLFICRVPDWHTTEMLAHHCLLQDGSQWLNYGTNPGVPQQRDRQKYSALWNFTHSQKHEVMPNAGKCIQLETIILSELNQSHKGIYHTFSLICGF